MQSNTAAGCMHKPPMVMLKESDHFISLERGDVLTAVKVFTAATGGRPQWQANRA